MISAIKRELMLAKIFQGGIAAIAFLGPIVISFIPYLRQYNNRTEISTEILGPAGLIGISTYMVFYIINQVIKCERESKSLERAVSFWGISTIILAKTAVAGGMAILCEIVVTIIFGFFQNEIGVYSIPMLGAVAINMIVFAWMGTVLMCITDSMFSNAVIAGAPFLHLTIALINRMSIYIILIVSEFFIGCLFYILLKKHIQEGQINWL